MNSLCKAMAEAKMFLKLKRRLTMIYVCPMKQTVRVNIANFKMRYLGDACQNKKSTFPNSFSVNK